MPILKTQTITCKTTTDMQNICAEDTRSSARGPLLPVTTSGVFFSDTFGL